VVSSSDPSSTVRDSTGLRCILEYDAEARQDGFSIG
jgi:hypothetical protein